MQKKASGVFVVLMMSFIILSFIFSGFQGTIIPSDSVAKVGHLEISIKEFQQELNQQLNMYKQFNGGKDLNSKEIEDLGIKKFVLNNLIQQKKVALFSNSLHLIPSKEELVNTIQSFPFMQSKNGPIDADTYKNFLARINYTAQDFEDEIAQKITTQNFSQFVSKLPMPKNFDKELNKISEKQMKLSLVQIKTNDARRLISIPFNDIQSYVQNNANENDLKNYFHAKRSLFVKNTKKKNDTKNTSDSEWKIYKEKVAEAILREKLPQEQIDEFIASYAKRIEILMQKGNFREIDRMSKKDGLLTVNGPEVKISALSTSVKNIPLDRDHLDKIFTTQNLKGNVFIFKNASSTKIVRAIPDFAIKKDGENSIDASTKNFKYEVINNYFRGIIKEMDDRIKVKISNNQV